MHYRFFGDSIADARVFRTNLMNVFVSFANHREAVESDLAKVIAGTFDLHYGDKNEEVIQHWNLSAAKTRTTHELYQECLADMQTLIDMSRSSTVCVWRYGDDGIDGKGWLEKRLQEFGPWDRVENFFALPHYREATRHITNAEQLARIRYEKAVQRKNEQARFGIC